MTKTVKTKSAPANSKKAAAARANSCTSQEEFWRNVAGKWQRIHGGITDAGVSVEWHDFVTASDLQWSRSFHSESLELCLNLEGCGAVHAGQKCLEFTPATAGFYFPGKRDLNALRAGGQRHRFLTVKFSRAFLRAQLAQCDGALTS